MFVFDVVLRRAVAFFLYSHTLSLLLYTYKNREFVLAMIEQQEVSAYLKFTRYKGSSVESINNKQQDKVKEKIYSKF